MNNMDVNQVLAQMRAMEASAKGFSSLSAPETSAADQTNFAQVMKQTVDKVNESQATAASLSTAYVAGSETVDLPEVMIAMQEASISFQAISQVRNRLLSAYQDVMNMPV